MQRYFSDLKKDNCLVLKKEDLYHIKTVMRMKENLIEVVYQNKLHICKLDKNYNALIVEALIVEVKDDINDKKIRYTLCIPLLQEQKMSFVLQKATELGVDEIIPVLTTRSIVKINDKEDKKIERWNKICKEASEQSKRLDIPVIKKITKIEDLKLDGLKLLCSTQEKENTLKNVLKNSSNYDKIIMIVGPEGGLTNEEEIKLKELDFVPITLGKNIMRVETVPIYLLSILNYEME